MDTQEQLQTEQTVNNVATEHVSEQESDVLSQYVEMTQEKLIEAARALLQHQPISEVREQMDFIKQMFYKKRPIATDTEKSEAEVKEETANPVEDSFKEVLNKYKALKTAENAAIEAQLNSNYEQKSKILTQLDELIKSNDDLSETIPAFRKLQTEWKQIGHVTQSKENDVWKEYNHFLEQFYDLVKINNDLRDYDFKKNLELKNALCDAAEALDTEEDIVKAFRMLQNLHEEWREIGPVSREERENIWNRFKAASTVINKKHQAYFESIKAQEEQMVDERIKTCEQVEAIDTTLLNSYKLWEEKSKEVIALNDFFKWDNPLSRRVNSKVYKRFRTACDCFFEARLAFFKESKEILNENLQKKRELTAQAEELKDSTDWKNTTDKLVELQKEWKLIGPVPKKFSDAIWTKFVSACDYFFEQKEKNFSTKKSEEKENLLQKMGIIEEIKNYVLSENEAENMAALKALVDKYNAIGHVPFKEKDKVYHLFKEITDKRYGEVKNSQRMQDIGLSKDRNKLLKKYDQLRSEIGTYENNIGFFNSSKKANTIVDDMMRKIEQLKKELAAVMEQIDMLDKKD